MEAPGGTGKTFLLNLLLAAVRVKKQIALAVASSGIAATLLKGGKTAHSQLKLPLNFDESEEPICNIDKNSSLANTIKKNFRIRLCGTQPTGMESCSNFIAKQKNCFGNNDPPITPGRSLLPQGAHYYPRYETTPPPPTNEHDSMLKYAFAKSVFTIFPVFWKV